MRCRAVQIRITCALEQFILTPSPPRTEAAGKQKTDSPDHGERTIVVCGKRRCHPVGADREIGEREPQTPANSGKSPLSGFDGDRSSGRVCDCGTVLKRFLDLPLTVVPEGSPDDAIQTARCSPAPARQQRTEAVECQATAPFRLQGAGGATNGSRYPLRANETILRRRASQNSSRLEDTRLDGRWRPAPFVAQCRRESGAKLQNCTDSTVDDNFAT